MRQCIKERRTKQKNAGSLEEAEAELISLKPNLGQGLITELLWKAKTMGCRKLPRLCNQKDGSFALFRKHFDKMEMQMNAALCNMCEKKNKWKCMICIKYFCVLSNKAWNGVSCCRNFHDQDYYALARCDYKIHGILCHNWKPPTKTTAKQNKKLIANSLWEIKEEDNALKTDNIFILFVTV